jgi:hypothetical protein
VVPRCSFCDRSRDEVKKLITSRSSMICDDCVGLAKAYIASPGLAGARSNARRCGELIDERFAGIEPRLMREPCEFCRDLIARCQFTAYGHVICDVCIGLCVDVLSEA